MTAFEAGFLILMACGVAAAHQAWQHAGCRGRTKPEIALLEEFANQETDR